MELGLHVLDLHRRSLLHYVNHTKSPASRSEDANTLILARMRYRAGRNTIIRSISEQYESGIRFKKSDSDSLLDVRFNKGILSLPTMVLDEVSEFLFLNIMAFEHLHMGTGNDVSLYIDFIISMLNTNKDARLLYEKRILVGTSDEDIMKFFTNLSKQLVLDPEAIVECSPFLAEFIKMQEYLFNTCRTSWSRWWENLKMTYFSNPWTILSLGAAIFLLGLTVVQAVYAIYPYYRPR